MARDMTDREFKAALERHGFKPDFGSMWFKHADYPNISFGGTYNPKTGKTMRRATLAHLIKRKEQEDAKREKQCNA